MRERKTYLVLFKFLSLVYWSSEEGEGETDRVATTHFQRDTEKWIKVLSQGPVGRVEE